MQFRLTKILAKIVLLSFWMRKLDFMAVSNANSFLIKIAEIINFDASYKNVVLDHQAVLDYFAGYSGDLASLVIADAVTCKDGYFNEGDIFDLHNNKAEIRIHFEHLEITDLNLTDKYNHRFICTGNAHDQIEQKLHHLIDDEESTFHRQLILWNFDVPRTEYHIGNGTHATVTFVCLRGFQLKVWHDLHLMTHVLVDKHGGVSFHEMMRECECTPDSCAYSVRSHLRSMGVKLSNPQVALHLEKTVCSEFNGGNAMGFTSGEILQDDVLCYNRQMEMSDDLIVRKCVIENDVKCVHHKDTQKNQERSHAVFAVVVGVLLSAILILLFY